MEQRKPKNQWFELVIFSSWALFFLFIITSKRLPLYINPKFSVLPLIGASLLIAMILSVKISNKRPSRENKDWSILAWFLMPILMSLLVPPAGLGMFIAKSREAEMLKAGRVDSNISLDLSRSAEYKNVRLDELAAASKIVSGKVSVVGQTILTTNQPTQNECLLVHYVMVCCAADLRPVSVLLKYPAGYLPENGKWVKVRGIASRDEKGVVLEVHTIEPIREPNPPYLY